MQIKRFFKSAACLFMLLSLPFLLRLGNSTDLVASLAQLPGLADTPDKGAFVDIVKAIDEVYTEGTIKIELYPFARSVNNVIAGKADFHIPTFRNLKIDQSKLPYGTVTEKMGKVRFVIYSNTDNPINKKMLDDAILNAKSGQFPYKIEGASGIESQYPFPVISTNDVTQGLRKVANKRIDALVWAQEEVDFTIKNLKLKNIRRELWQDFEDAIIISKGPGGDRINNILSDALRKLRASGKLEQLYSKIHRPYENWQPADMGW
ncbi:MAG: transporter substrate-binding domain-containing protein [Spirochaetota bacterium]